MSSIKTITIIGEKCTGAMYLGKLIKKNLKTDISITRDSYFIDIFDDELINSNDETLYIIIYRDFIDWAKCYYKNHFVTTPTNENISFMEFLRTKWAPVDEDGEEVVYERNLMTLEHFQNVFSARKAKITNHLNIKNIVRNVFVVQYEKLKTDFPKIIKEISTKFNIPIIEKLETIPFIEEKLLPDISDEEKTYIYENLDMTLEKKLGYDFNILTVNRENIKDVIKDILKQSQSIVPKTTAEIITGHEYQTDKSLTHDKKITDLDLLKINNFTDIKTPKTDLKAKKSVPEQDEHLPLQCKKNRGFSRSGGGLNTLIKKTTGVSGIIQDEKGDTSKVSSNTNTSTNTKQDDRKKMCHKKVMKLFR